MVELTTYQFNGRGMPIIPFTMLMSAVETGFPSPALSCFEDCISLDRTLIKNPDFTYLMGVVGDSMIGAGIYPSSWILVDRSLDASDGKIIVACIDGELTVRYYKRTATECFLDPSNSGYEPITITAFMNFSVWGVVIHIITSTKPVNYVCFS
jgi:DNA polymerase V